MLPSLLGCVLLGVIVPAPEPVAKYWLEFQVIEYPGQGLKNISGTGGFVVPKNAKAIRTVWHPLAAGQPATLDRQPLSRVSIQLQFNRYGVESHHVEIDIEHTTGQGRAEFTYGASVRLDLEPGGSVAFGDVPYGSQGRRHAFTVTLRRWK
jgi:hypothetical protein